MAEDAMTALSEAIARRATDTALGEYGNYVYGGEPNTVYRPSLYRAIGGAPPAYMYEQYPANVPIGETGWEIPGTREVGRGYSDRGMLEQFSRKTIYPNTPMAFPAEGSGTEMTSGGFDFGGALLPETTPSQSEINKAAIGILPERLNIRPGKSGTSVPLFDVDRIPWAQR